MRKDKEKSKGNKIEHRQRKKLDERRKVEDKERDRSRRVIPYKHGTYKRSDTHHLRFP